MGKHVTGKWGRGEGLEQKSARKRKGLRGNSRHLAQYQFKKGDTHARRVQAWCYVCSEAHPWEEGCLPPLKEAS